MLENDVVKGLQVYISQKTCIVIGSGLSVSEGLPSMNELKNELIDKIKLNEHSDDKNKWDNIVKNLNNGSGLEEAMLQESLSNEMEQIIKKVTYNFIKIKEKKVIEEHFCTDRKFKFEKMLNAFKIGDNGLDIITTNYDRLIEASAEFNGINVDKMFYGSMFKTFNKSMSKYRYIRKFDGKKKISYFTKINLYKVHGSLDFYEQNGKYFSSDYDFDISPLIITPGNNKYKTGYNLPFDDIRTKANAAIENAEYVILIGYGFNDYHLETHLRNQIKEGKKVLLITKTLSDNAKELIVHDNFNFITEINDGSMIKLNGKEFFSTKKLWDIEKFMEEILNE